MFTEHSGILRRMALCHYPGKINLSIFFFTLILSRIISLFCLYAYSTLTLRFGMQSEFYISSVLNVFAAIFQRLPAAWRHIMMTIRPFAKTTAAFMDGTI